MNNITTDCSSTDALISECKSLKKQNQRLARDLKNAKRCIHRLKIQKKKLLDKIKTNSSAKKTTRAVTGFFSANASLTNKLPKK